MTKLLIDLEADPIQDSEVLLYTNIRETRLEQATRLINEWLMQHNINATYTHDRYTDSFLRADLTRIVFANQKEEFKYNLAGGDVALQRHYRSGMYGTTHIFMIQTWQN